MGRADEVFLLFGGGFGARMEVVPCTSDVKAVFSGRGGKAGPARVVDLGLSSCERDGPKDADPGNVSELPSARAPLSSFSTAAAGRSPAAWILSATAG